MLPVTPSITIHLTFEQVTDRLAARPEVEGLLAIGSTGREAVTAASDYDLVVVLNAMPAPLKIALTYVDHRLTDIIFVRAGEVEGAAGQWEAAQLRGWLRAGRIVFDRAGRLRAAQARATAAAEAESPHRERYAAWFSTNYNLQQTRRMLASDDPAYQMAVDLRLLFSLHEVWRHYFTARGLTVAGEKDQTRFLLAHDADFLSAFHDTLQAPDRQTKFALYERLAQTAIAPLGGLWADEMTSIMPDPGVPWDANTPSQALAFWQRLVGDDAESARR